MYFHNTFALVLYDRKDIAWFLRQQAYFWPYDGMLVLSRVEGLYYRAIHDKVFVVPNPMTLSIPSTSIESVMQVDRPFEIVWLARLHMHYNYRDIPEIMSMVVEQEPNVHLNILANIPEGNPEFDSFVDEINARGLGDVITLKGYQSDITPFLEAADAHLLLSEMGGWAMTVAEAAAYGLPTVCYDLPWLELWRNSKGMLISASRDKRAVAQNITELIRDVSLKSRLSNEALEMAQILAILDYPTIWRRVFDQMILKRGSHSSENVDDRSDIVNVWGERYDISRDDDAQETAEIMVRTYNHFLEGCL
jgi:glycosyltransferase involved in cell wall biosynthesis